MVSDSAVNKPMPFANVIVYLNDSAVSGGQTDMTGHYSVYVSEPGLYFIKAGFMHYSAGLKNIKLMKDTIINLSMTRPLQYEQPCRQKIVQKKISLDLPAEHNDYCEYKRIMSNTGKLGLDFLTKRKEKLYIRLWTEPAFDYYGGSVTDLFKAGEGWIAHQKFYTSNYLEYLDYLDSTDTEKSDCSGCNYDFDYLQNMKFSMTKVDDTSISNAWSDKSPESIIKSFFAIEDYCVQMLAGDRHPCTDGVTYHLEIKAGNRYKFLTFENPQCLDSSYVQVSLFLNLLKDIEDIMYTTNECKTSCISAGKEIQKSELFPTYAFRLTQWMLDTTMLYGKYPLNETVYYLDDSTGLSYKAKTILHHSHWDESISDTVVYTMTEPMFFPNPQKINVAIQSDTALDFTLLKSTSVKNTESVEYYDSIIRASGLLDSIQVADGKNYNKLNFQIHNDIRNVVYNDFSFMIVSYLLFDGTTSGPRFIVLNDKVYFLTGLCSFQDFSIFTINGHLLVKTGTSGCDSAILIDQIFEIRKDGIFEIFSDSSRSM